jgi:hypothetical protein
MTKKQNLYPEEVFLDGQTHRYFDREGNEYCGFSRFFENLKEPFKKDLIAIQTAARDNTTPLEVLAGWDSKTENGNYYDKALEECVDPINYEKHPNIADHVREILSEYDPYYSTFEQTVVYNKHYRIAGSTDKLMVTSSRPNSMFCISDFKTFEKGESDLYLKRGWLKAPLSHLTDCKFNKIAFQLSFYAFQVEDLTGKKCRELFIHLIDPINKTHKKIFVPYMRTDVILCLESFKSNILSTLATAGEDIF